MAQIVQICTILLYNFKCTMNRMREVEPGDEASPCSHLSFHSLKQGGALYRIYFYINVPGPAKLTFLFLLLDLWCGLPRREILRAGGGAVWLEEPPISEPELEQREYNCIKL